MARLLIIDDDADFRQSLAETLRDLGHVAEEAASAEAGLAAARHRRPDAAFLDLRMPGMDGIAALAHLRALSDSLPVVILTAHATSSNTIEAMRLGAFDHLVKPVGRADLHALLTRMLAPPPTAPPAPDAADANEIIGFSPAIRAVQKQVGLASGSDATVLITGETGTGKEMVARALHRHGPRAERPFVAVNCAAIPAELLESELFGHERGAFTGAVTQRRGRFREADGGSIFLDEIGDMPAAMQAKILRVLQERVASPVGGAPVPVDVRIIAATHRDLRPASDAGSFRADLYYRLAVLPIVVPPLRDRGVDIVLLAEHFLRIANSATPKRLAPNAAALLLAHPWPGNVRELRNAMERVNALVRGPVIEAADLVFLAESPMTADDSAIILDLPGAVARTETALIRRALAETGGNRAEAARRLGINRQLLYQKLRRYGIEEVSGNRTSPVPKPDGDDDGVD